MAVKSFDIKELRAMKSHGRGTAPETAAATTAGKSRAAEAKLIAAARRGDADALTTLVERLSGPVWRFGQSFCRHPEDAEDVQQEVMTALVRGLDQFEGRSSLSTWAWMVARNACRRLRRRKAGEPEHLDSLDGDANGSGAYGTRADDPLHAIERAELGETLAAALRALPDGQRDVLLLRDVEGLSAARVAKLLGLTERAVKSRLHRARLAVRRMMTPLLRPAANDATPDSPRCPDTARLASRYIEGDIDRATCARLQKHVSDCPECLTACRSLRETLARCGAWGSRPAPAGFRRALARELRRAPSPRAKRQETKRRPGGSAPTDSASRSPGKTRRHRAPRAG